MRWMIIIIAMGLCGCDVYPAWECNDFDEKVSLPELSYTADTSMTYHYYDTKGEDLLVEFDSIVTKGLLISKDYYCHAEYEAVSLYAYSQNFELKILQVARDQNDYNGKLKVELIKGQLIIFEIEVDAPRSDYEKIDYIFEKRLIYSAEEGINILQTDEFTFNRLK